MSFRTSPRGSLIPFDMQEQHSQPIFSADWGADEELLLISGLILNGLGNWAEAAGHVGTRTKEECERHYLEVFLGVGEAEMKENGMEVDETINGFRKRRREFMPVGGTYPTTIARIAHVSSR